MSKKNPKVLVIATSRKTRGGITSVVKAHETGAQWKKYHCKWIETHIDRNVYYKLFYLFRALIQFILLLPFYDIVHIHVANNYSVRRKMIFFCISKIFDKKTIVHFHPPGSDIFLNRKTKSLYINLFTKCDLVLVLSNQWKVWLQDILNITNKIEVLYNPCPVAKIYDTVKKEKSILFIGYIEKRKGYTDFIKAFATIANQYPQWSIVLAGTGEIEKGKILCKQLKIENQVRFMGWVTGKEKEQLLNKTSIFCLPSYGEGFPMVILEAWAYGLPVITTPVGGIPDIVKDNENGMLFAPGNISELSKKMDLMISNSWLRDSIAEQSKKMATTIFNINAINEHLFTIYKKLIQK
jgi:glycosyltransferase involved in cell wall biosynthesis